MESFASALNYGIPFFTVLVLLEMAYGYWKGVRYFNIMDSVSSLSSGITNITKSVLGLTIAIISYEWLVDKVALFDLQPHWWVFVIAFVGLDFAGYWIHRIEHKVNFFWNRHIIHHSSEEFNLPCALRQSISHLFSFTVFFLVPIAFLGVPAKVFAIIAPIQLFSQFWYHTRYIGRMGILEYILVTPSHHRVHHAINPEYIDKNFSQIFIIWDKLFGTFQEEKDDVPAVYGVKKAARTWNPIIINFQHAWMVVTDAWRADSWWDKARVWFMPTGWRPADVAAKYPVEVIEDVYTQEKYDTKPSTAMDVWASVQMTVTLFMSMYLFNRLADLPTWQLLLYGGFIMLTVFSYTTLMDKKPVAFWLEAFRTIVGVSIIIALGDWFLLGEWIPAGKWIVGLYLLSSLLVTAAFVKWEVSEFVAERQAEVQLG